MQCTKCRSDEIKQTSGSYPNSYECNKCGHMFVKAPQALIDE